MADNTILTTGLANDTPTEWFRAELLERSERYEVFTRFGVQVNLPSNQGDTVQFVRYERPGLPGVLSEGVTPDGQSLTVNKITANVDQFGGYFTLSDTAILQTFHGPFEQVAELAAQQYASVRDREAQRVLRRATNVYGANGTSKATLTGTDYFSTGDAVKVLEGLRAKGAPTYSDGLYAVIVPTSIEADLINDATWLQTQVQQDRGPLERGEIMRWMGGKFLRSNQIPSYVNSTSAAPTLGATTVTGSETGLADATYRVSLVGVDRYGQEVCTSAGSHTQATSGANVILTVQTPANFTTPAGVLTTGFNIYVSSGGVDTQRLQLRGASASTTYRVSGNGANALGIAYSTGGQLIEVTPVASVTIHPIFFIGRGYFACIANGSVVTTMTAPTTSGRTTDSDPLGQRRKVGWKAWNKDAILNENFGAILWAASRYNGYQSV